MDAKPNPVLLDYRALRLLMGLIALSLPVVVVTLASPQSLASISASWYTNARDMFVGQLFVVGSFLFAYNGHSSCESSASKIASIAAICVAIFPTPCDSCDVGPVAIAHYLAAASLFSVLAYFCFIPFQKNIKGQPGKGKARRKWIYFICGSLMIICMAIMGLANWLLSPEHLKAWRITFWGETISLMSFGIAWITSGKTFRWIADEDEIYRPFGKG